MIMNAHDSAGWKWYSSVVLCLQTTRYANGSSMASKRERETGDSQASIRWSVILGNEKTTGLWQDQFRWLWRNEIRGHRSRSMLRCAGSIEKVPRLPIETANRCSTGSTDFNVHGHSMFSSIRRPCCISISTLLRYLVITRTCLFLLVARIDMFTSSISNETLQIVSSITTRFSPWTPIRSRLTDSFLVRFSRAADSWNKVYLNFWWVQMQHEKHSRSLRQSEISPFVDSDPSNQNRLNSCAFA